MTTEFGKYLKQYPSVLKDKTRTLSLLRDALNNDLPKFRVLQAAYELGILDAIQRSKPISTDDRMKITTGLVSQYVILENAAKYAIDYWQASVDAEILFRTFHGVDECEENPVSFAESVLPQEPSESIPHTPEKLLQIRSISQDSIRLGIRLQWEKQPEIESYEIWRAKDAEPPVKVKEGAFPIPRYQDCDVEANGLYTYALCGLNEKGTILVRSLDVQMTAPSKPPAFQIRELQFALSGIQIKWNMLFEAQKYVVRKKTVAAGWVTLAELPVEQTGYLDVSAQDGTAVKYKIFCICKNNTMLETSEIEVKR